MSQAEVTPFTREVVDLHLAAFPAVTPLANAGPHLRTWLLTASLALAAAIAAVGLVWLRKRGLRARKATTSPPAEPAGGRVVW